MRRAGAGAGGAGAAESEPGARAAHGRWAGYLIAGGVAAATVGPWLVLVLAACGLTEVAVRTQRARQRSAPGRPGPPGLPGVMLPLAAAVPAAAGLLAVAWEGFKVGALSYGGGFVIIPLMQHDAVHTYHWMTAGQFLSAVALGQVTPGPVVQTVAVVGYAAAGVGGGLLAALVAFAPSFLFVLGGGRYFDRLRASAAVQAFLSWGRPGRHRRHRRSCGPAGPGPRPPVAVRPARARRDLAARPAARGGQRDRGRGRARGTGVRRRRPRGLSRAVGRAVRWAEPCGGPGPAGGAEPWTGRARPKNALAAG